MAVTFSSLLTSIRRNLRDENGTTWSDNQIGELVNQGIDAVTSVYPRENIEVQAYTQPGQGVIFSVSLSSVTWPMRVDVYNSDGKYSETLYPTVGGGIDSGWEIHGGVLYFPTNYTFASNTGTLRIFGYSDWAQITIGVSSSTTDLDIKAQNAVKVFVQAEALSMLTFDRAQFQQWQVGAGNSDVSALGLNNLALAAQQRWRSEKARIRSMRKLG